MPLLPLWSNGPQLHGGNPIGFVPASKAGVYIESIKQNRLRVFAMFTPGMMVINMALTYGNYSILTIYCITDAAEIDCERLQCWGFSIGGSLNR